MQARIFTFLMMFLTMFSQFNISNLCAMESIKVSQREHSGKTVKQGLKIEEVAKLLESKKIEYAKNFAPERRVTGKNKGTLLRIIFKSPIIQTAFVVIFFVIIWQPLRSMLGVTTSCTPVEDKTMLSLVTQPLVNLTANVMTAAKANVTTSANLFCQTTENKDITEMFDALGWSIKYILAGAILSAFSAIAYEIRSLSPTPSERLEDVIGLDAQTADRIERYIDMFKNPEKYKKFGATLPRGLLLVGPAGTGKSLIAAAIAGNTRKAFYDAPATSFSWEGNVKSKFKSARKNRPSVLFIDEIDAIGAIDKNRQSSGGDDIQAVRVLNQLLLELGSKENDGIIVIAATNYPNILNPALVRSGRFDEVLEIPKPNFSGRVKLLMYYIFKNKMIDVDSITPAFIMDLSKRTDGFTASDFEAIVNHAALNACRQLSVKINADHIIEGLTIIESNRSALAKQYC